MCVSSKDMLGGSVYTRGCVPAGTVGAEPGGSKLMRMPGDRLEPHRVPRWLGQDLGPNWWP